MIDPYNELSGTPEVAAPKGSEAWAEQNSGMKRPDAPSLDPVKSILPTDKVTPSSPSQPKLKSLSYEEMYKLSEPDFKIPTPEEIEKQRKKEKRDKIFAAIGDGISALSNLFFAGKGAPNMYTGVNNMSDRMKVHYDNLSKERKANTKAYIDGLAGARRMDQEKEDRDRNYQHTIDLYNYQKDRDAKADMVRAEQDAYKRERDKVQDERTAALDAERAAQAAQAQANADRAYELQKQSLADNRAARKATAEATSQKALNKAIATRRGGSQLAFVADDGSKVAIWPNTWKASMQQVFDILAKDPAALGLKRVPRNMSAQQKEDFVKQYWDKSPKAKQLMMELGKQDPATMQSEINDWSEYEQASDDQSDDTDFSQYLIK